MRHRASCDVCPWWTEKRTMVGALRAGVSHAKRHVDQSHQDAATIAPSPRSGPERAQ